MIKNGRVYFLSRPQRFGKSLTVTTFEALFLDGQVFFNFWFESGTASVIAKYLKAKKLTVEQFRNFPVSQDFIHSSVEIEKAKPESFLFQTGYLSLREGASKEYALDYPNTEVLNAMSTLVAQNMMEERGDNYDSCTNILFTAFMRNDFDLFIKTLNSLLASIPYDDFTGAAQENIWIHNYTFPAQEWLYRSSLFAFFRGCGLVVAAEMHSNLGRADLVISHKGKTWVIEIKVAYEGDNTVEKAKEALKQIVAKNYAKPYPGAVCIGLAIDNALRQITHYNVVTDLG